MKSMKKIAVIAAAVIMSLLFVFLVSADEAGISELSVSFETGTSTGSVSWWETSGQYFIFLPADADTLKLDFTASGEVTLDGTAVNSGDSVDFTAGKSYVLACGEKSYNISVLKSESIPSLHITTESGSMDAVHADKSHKEEAAITIIADGETVMEDTELDYIKGRGNSTWAMTKKPYNIKFADKIDLFGMGKAKKWSLLANHSDKTFIRNTVAFDIADKVGIDFVSKSIAVDLFINGEYYGNYLLCESVEVGSTRVDINDLEGDTEDVNTKDLDEYSLGGNRESDYKKLPGNTQKWVNIPNNPENITGGYLLEFDLPNRYVEEVSGFVTTKNQAVVLKSPEYASEAQVKYISALYQEFEDAVYSEDGYNSLGKHYTEYIDVDSFVTMYVFQEYAKNLDSGTTSYYIYKDKDSDVFVAAPAWDYDYALGNSYEAYDSNISVPTGWWASGLYYKSANDAKYLSTLNAALFKHDDFYALAAEKWNGTFAPLLNNTYFAEIEAYAEEMTPSAIMNAVRWNYFKTTDVGTVSSEYKKQISDVLLKFMKERKSFLNEGFGENSVRVFFDGNGAEGNMFNRKAVKAGDSYTLPQSDFEKSGYVFKGWSTAPDGSGEVYEAGEKVTVDGGKVTFYAQWQEIKILTGFQKFIQAIKDFFNMIREFFANLF